MKFILLIIIIFFESFDIFIDKISLKGIEIFFFKKTELKHKLFLVIYKTPKLKFTREHEICFINCSFILKILWNFFSDDVII